jgi:hypothetical protein
MPRGFQQLDGGSIAAPFIDSRDFDRAARAIFEMAEWIEDTSTPLLEAREIARHDMDRRFSTQIDPLGKPWEKLSRFYATEKQNAVGFVLPILTREGALHSAAIDESAWFIEGDSVMFSTANLPDYWAYHQQELGRFPKFKTMSTKRTVMKRGVWRGKIGVWPVKTKYDISYQEHGMPQRAFIGLSEEAQEKIALAIDRWFTLGIDSAVVGYKSSGGGSITSSVSITEMFPIVAPGSHGKPQRRTSGGLFGPMV